MVHFYKLIFAFLLQTQIMFTYVCKLDGKKQCKRNVPTNIVIANCVISFSN